ncbi:MAG: DUF3089 domain-containing protein [Acidimicrobiales bacterium]|nr:DUF3089 domain-containing protein [Acidimicrobiales bacterium]
MLTVLVALAFVAAACGDDDDPASGTPPTAADTSGAVAADGAGDAGDGSETPVAGEVSDVYADDAHWLCKPGLPDDVCARDLDATVVFADGSTQVQPHVAAEDPPVDCFYVYPTVSRDESPNSDLVPGESEEVYVTYNQAARFTAACRVFAPMYRQGTLPSLLGQVEVPEGVDRYAIAYGDVRDAFEHYLATENDGRGFVLIGHSQGAGLLRELVAEEIDPDPALREQLVSALLLGATIEVPEGEVVGADFQQVPVCESAEQTGCVVSYATFRDSAPPPADTDFGVAGTPGDQAVCVNPAAPAGGDATLTGYFLVTEFPGSLGSPAQPFADPASAPAIETPFVTYPDFVVGRCRADAERGWLEISVAGDPADPRTDDIGGDLTPEWGMHLVDVNVALGDLVELVRTQGSAYAG